MLIQYVPKITVGSYQNKVIGDLSFWKSRRFHFSHVHTLQKVHPRNVELFAVISSDL